MKYSLNRVNNSLLYTGTLLLGMVFSSCSNNDNSPTPQKPDGSKTKSSGITMAFKTTGKGETEFIINQADVSSGEISAVGKGIEQTGWRFYYRVGKTLFASGYSDDNQCAGYAANNEGKIVKKGEFIFENSLEMFGGTADDKTLLAMEIPRNGFANRRLHFVNVNTVSVNKIVGTRIFESKKDSIVAWPTALKVKGNKLFVPFHKTDARKGKALGTVRPDSAYIAVYSFPDMKKTPEKIISDPRTSNIGVNGSTTGIIETDKGDLYTYSCGAKMAGFTTASKKPSGILRIKNNTTEFDKSYFFNIEEATNGGKIFWFDYVGGNKALARILTDDKGPVWGAYGRKFFNQKLVIIDLEAKTITDVANVPLHAKRYTSPIFVENGKVLVSIETASEAYVYSIDINTATGTKGAKIKGKTIKGFYKL